MPDVNKRISDMERATSVAPSTLFFSSIADETSESGYSTRASELQVVALEMLLNMEFASDLETTAKQIIPAINEAAKSGGGGGGSDVEMKYNPAAGVDLTVDGFTENLALMHNVEQTEGRLNTKYSYLAGLVEIDEADLTAMLNSVFGG